MNQTAANRVADLIHRLDKRRTYNHERIEHEGNVWHIDAKLDPATGKLNVYRVHGDVTNEAGLNEAIASFANTELLRIAAKREKARG